MGGVWMPLVVDDHYTLADWAWSVRVCVEQRAARCLSEEQRQAHGQVRFFAQRARAHASWLGFRSWESCSP